MTRALAMAAASSRLEWCSQFARTRIMSTICNSGTERRALPFFGGLGSRIAARSWTPDGLSQSTLSSSGGRVPAALSGLARSVSLARVDSILVKAQQHQVGAQAASTKVVVRCPMARRDRVSVLESKCGRLRSAVPPVGRGWYASAAWPRLVLNRNTPLLRRRSRAPSSGSRSTTPRTAFASSKCRHAASATR